MSSPQSSGHPETTPQMGKTSWSKASYLGKLSSLLYWPLWRTCPLLGGMASLQMQHADRVHLSSKPRSPGFPFRCQQHQLAQVSKLGTLDAHSIPPSPILPVVGVLEIDFPKCLPTHPSLSVPTTLRLTEASLALTCAMARAHEKLRHLSPSLPQTFLVTTTWPTPEIAIGPCTPVL